MSQRLTRYSQFGADRFSEVGASDASGGVMIGGTIIDLPWIWRAIKQNIRTIAGSIAACALLGVVYLLLATPQYTATGELVFDLREPKVISSNPILQSLGADQYVIESQVELVKSRLILQRVIERFGLVELTDTRPTPLPAGQRQPTGEADSIPDKVFEGFARRLSAQRKGTSFVIEVSYLDRNPQRAARVANAIMEAYIAEQRRIKVDTVSAANKWLSARVDELRDRLIEAERQVQEFKTEEAQVNARVMGNIYATFLMRLKETQSQESLQTSDARIVSYAVVPSKPSSPKTLMTMAGMGLAGLSLGLFLAFFRAMRQPVIQDAWDAERVSGLPVLGQLDNIANESERPVGNGSNGDANAPDFRSRMAALHVLHHPNSDYTQSIFTLKHVIEQAEPTNGSKLVAIVSPRSGDGKTTLATNLARYAASAGLKTLLADTDLRTAMASQRIHPGAISVGPTAIQDVAARLKNAVVKDPRSTLMLYPATETRHTMARPADVLASRSFPGVVRRMREEYEFVVFDTPGTLDFPDARLLVRLVDWIVVVVNAGQTTREDLERLLRECAVDQWSGATGKVLGIVLNHGPLVAEASEPVTTASGSLKRFINATHAWPNGENRDAAAGNEADPVEERRNVS